MGLLNIELSKGSKFKYSPDEEDTTLALMREMACLEASFSERNIDASPLTYAEVCTVVAALERSNARYLSVGRDDGSRVFNKHPADETLFDPRTNAANMATMPDEGAGSHGIYVYNKSMTIDRWRRTVNKFENKRTSRGPACVERRDEGENHCCRRIAARHTRPGVHRVRVGQNIEREEKM